MTAPAKLYRPAHGGWADTRISQQFEYAPTEAQFRCEFAVYPKDGHSSLCYVTDKNRARLIVSALRVFALTGWMDQFLKNAEAGAAKCGGRGG